VTRRKVSLSAAQRQAMEGSAQRDLNEIKGLIEKLQQADPRLRDRRRLASLLIDLRTETQAAESAFQVKAKAFDEKVKAYNAGGRLARLTLPSRADLEAADAELVKERERINTVFGAPRACADCCALSRKRSPISTSCTPATSRPTRHRLPHGSRHRAS
jgi:DNA repair exonuclease SbcCD ATPase subunit